MNESNEHYYELYDWPCYCDNTLGLQHMFMCACICEEILFLHSFLIFLE